MAAQGLRALLALAGLGRQGLATRLAFGAHGLAPWATAGSAAAVRSPPIATIEPSVCSVFLSFDIFLSVVVDRRSGVKAVSLG